jgi:hypothetical protein
MQHAALIARLCEASEGSAELSNGNVISICARLSSLLWPKGRRALPALRESRSARRERLGWANARELLDDVSESLSDLRMPSSMSDHARGFLKRIGATMMPRHGALDVSPRAYAMSFDRMPAEMMIAYQRSSTNHLSFEWWSKIRSHEIPKTVARMRGAAGYYLVSLFFQGFKGGPDKLSGRLQERPTTYVAVMPDGTAHGMPYLHTSTQVVRRRRASSRRVEVPAQRVVMNECPRRERPEFTWTHNLRVVLAAYVERDMALNVRVRKGDATVVAPIPMNDAKVFFRKRIDAMTAAGKRRPIFHWVIAHRRVTGANVRTHTRGSKNFQWGGCDVSIRVPGRDAPMVTEWTSTAIHGDAENEPTVLMDVVAQLLDGEKVAA